MQTEIKKRVRMHKTREDAIRAVNHVKSFHHKSFDLFRDDEQVAFSAVERDEENFRFVSDRLKRSKDFFLKLIRSGVRTGSFSDTHRLCEPVFGAHCVRYVNPEILEDRAVVIELIQKSVMEVSDLSESQRDDIGIMTQAFRCQLSSLSDASPRLQKDRDAILAKLRAMGNSEWRSDSLLKVPSTNLESLYGDEEVMSLFLERQPHATIGLVSDELRDNWQFMVKAMKQRASFFEYSSSRLRDDRSFVLDAIMIGSFDLALVSERLRDDEIVAFAAVMFDASQLRHVSSRLRGCKKLVLQACIKRSSAIQYADEAIQDFVGQREPVPAILELIEKEELHDDMQVKLPMQSGSSDNSRRIQKI